MLDGSWVLIVPPLRSHITSTSGISTLVVSTSIFCMVSINFTAASFIGTNASPIEVEQSSTNTTAMRLLISSEEDASSTSSAYKLPSRVKILI